MRTVWEGGETSLTSFRPCLATSAVGWRFNHIAGLSRLFPLCEAMLGCLVREEPVLSGSLAVRKVGGKWQEECWVSVKLGKVSITPFVIDSFPFMYAAVPTFCSPGPTDGLEVEPVEQCGTF